MQNTYVIFYVVNLEGEHSSHTPLAAEAARAGVAPDAIEDGRSGHRLCFTDGMLAYFLLAGAPDFGRWPPHGGTRRAAPLAGFAAGLFSRNTRSSTGGVGVNSGCSAILFQAQLPFRKTTAMTKCTVCTSSGIARYIALLLLKHRCLHRTLHADALPAPLEGDEPAEGGDVFQGAKS